MKLILILLGGFMTISAQHFFLAPTVTSPEYFPYHAYVDSDLYCLGALITVRFVLVNAICIESQRAATVYLGALKNPYYRGRQDGQQIKASELITHPGFSKLYHERQLVNNIGLVKLRSPVLLTATVYPVDLPSKLDYPLQPGTYVNVTGYIDRMFQSNAIRFMTVRIRPQDQCIQIYAENLVTAERCVEGLGDDRLDWPGAFVAQGKLLGLARVLGRKIKCVIKSLPCHPLDVFLSIEEYLDWIHDNIGEMGKLGGE